MGPDLEINSILFYSVRLLLWPKLPTYFDDVTKMEHNRQVRVNIDATLVAIFHIAKYKTHCDYWV